MSMSKLVHNEIITVRWGDMDALNHVNNAVYFRYMEQARISWFDRIGLAMIENNEGPVVVSARCDFLKPIVYPATIQVSVELGRAGRSSFVIHHALTGVDPSQVKFAQGETTIVWINHMRVKSIALPPTLRARFNTE